MKNHTNNIEEIAGELEYPDLLKDEKIAKRELRGILAIGALAGACLFYACIDMASSFANKSICRRLSTEYSNVVYTSGYNARDADALMGEINSIKKDRNLNPSPELRALMDKIQTDFEKRGLVSY